MPEPIESRIQSNLDLLFEKGRLRQDVDREFVRTILMQCVEMGATQQKRINRHEDDKSIFLDHLMEHLPDRIYFKDSESRFLMGNKAFIEHFGEHDADAIVGKTDFDYFPYKFAIQKYADEQRIIQTGQPMAIKDEHDERVGRSVEWSSTIKLPLFSKDGEVIGTFGVSRDITEKKLAEERLINLAHQLQLKNQQIETDLEMARKVQMAFLPKSYPPFIWDLSSSESALRFFHRYYPSEALAGDFFQVIPISNSQAGVIICDVMGHGVRAALITAVLRGLVGELKLITPYPHVFLRKVNRSLNTVFKQLDMTLFVTAFYGVFDLLKGQFRYANAGHPQPILTQRSSQVSGILQAATTEPEPALGLIENFRYSSGSIPIAPGDNVLFYTDGILEVEREDGQQFGRKRLLELIRSQSSESADTVLTNLFDSIRDFSGGRGAQDDMCAVSVEVARIAADARSGAQKDE